MGVQYYCENKKRRQILRDAVISLNGIDYLEVLDSESPAGTYSQQTLLVRMLKTSPWLDTDSDGLSFNFVQIEGGVRVTSIKVLWALRASEASDALVSQGVITDEENDFYRSLPNADHVLVVRIEGEGDGVGDFSTYQLKLVQSSTNPAPPAGFDPLLSTVSFSFKVECPSEFDCQTEPICQLPFEEPPIIDYLSKDYASFRQLMLDRLAVIMPDWRERNPADVGVAIVEVLAYVGDYLSYYQDAVATEAYLGTARRRVSIRRHARLLDYEMHEGCNARTWIHVEVNADNIPLPRGTQLITRVSGYGTRIQANSTDYIQLISQNPEIYETVNDALFFVNHNEMEFYTWGDEDCCLPAGATHATLLGDFSSLKAGDILVFLEKRGPTTGIEADADPEHRQAVRLTSVTVTEDPLGELIVDPNDPNPQPIAVTQIAWKQEDALQFPLCLRKMEVPGETEVQPVSIALGNIVLADHGRTIINETLPLVPAVGQYRPNLERSGVTYCNYWGMDEDVLQDRAAQELLIQNPCETLPAVTVLAGAEIWRPQRDLLNSGRFETEFVVETESNGRAYLRFGDGVYGRSPTSGTLFSAEYRIGNGQRGNIGAHAIAHIVSTDSGIERVDNPIPASGGTEPESIEEVCLYAPQAFRTQERAVTEADYAEVAQRHPEVQKAVAVRRWTGSWYTQFLTVDRIGGRPVDDEFESQLRLFLERFRMAGQDLEIAEPKFVPLDIALVVCVEPNHFRSDVKKTLLDIFSSRILADGRRGYFHPDNFTFGQSVYLSQIVATAMTVPGVRWIDTEPSASKSIRFKRWGQTAQGELEASQIDFEYLEIARLDNDPNAPENGKIEFTMDGGL